MGQRCWHCDRNLGLSDIVRTCISCQHGVCSDCLTLKVGKGERFLCVKCSDGHRYTYKDRLVPVRPVAVNSKADNARQVWAIFDERSNNILHVSLSKDPTVAYNRHLSYIVKLADKLYDAGIFIGRIWFDTEFMSVYPEANIRLGDSVRRTMLWQKYDLATGVPYGIKLKRDYGHGWLGDIEVVL